jgi:acyl-CoA hydrolase
MQTEQTRVTRGVFTYVAVDNEGKPVPVKRDAA